LRRGNKTYVKSLVALGVLLAVFAGYSFAAVEVVKEKEFTTWPSTIYYMATLSGPDESNYKDITVRITAVDTYILYINGEQIGSDNNWETVEKYSVTVSGGNIAVGVIVENTGVGNGNGLMVDIQAGSDWLGTTTMKRRSAKVGETRKVYPVIWYYYAENIVDFLGEDWYKNINKNLIDTNITAKMGYVILGDMGEFDYHTDPHIERVTGFGKNIDLGSAENGGVKLRRIEGENIALGKPGQEAGLTDGNTFIGYTFNQSPLNAKNGLTLRNYTGSTK